MTVRLLVGDCRTVLRDLPAKSVHCCITSPPYFGLRSYLPDGHADKAREIGLERTPAEFVATLVDVFREVRRVLRDDGTVWLNLGDSYAGNRQEKGRPPWAGPKAAAAGRPVTCSRRRDDTPIPRSDVRLPGLKPKDLIGIPWRVALALQDDGWWLRQDIIWHKPNPMPENLRDRCTKAHEYLFLLSKRARYWSDFPAIAERAVKAGQVVHSYNSGAKDRQDVSAVNDRRTRIGIANWNQPVPEFRNRRSVWTIPTEPFEGAHFATMAPQLARDCVRAGCPRGGTVLDPFGGAGTTGLVADQEQRQAILIELNAEAAAIAQARIIAGTTPLLTQCFGTGQAVELVEGAPA